METHLPTPMTARVYVNLLEGRCGVKTGRGNEQTTIAWSEKGCTIRGNPPRCFFQNHPEMMGKSTKSDDVFIIVHGQV